MRYPTYIAVAASPVVIPGVPGRRVRIHKVSAPGAITIADGTGDNAVVGSTTWNSTQTSELFYEPLRSAVAGAPVTVTSGTAGTVSVQYSYEGA